MDLKVLYGGLSKERNSMIESLIDRSPKNLVGSSLGTKVTRVALKRALQDSTVSIVLLSESDYNNQVQAGLSDDRLVCVFTDDSIVNVFQSMFGVESDEETSSPIIENELIIDESEDLDSETDDLDELSWEQVLENYNKLGSEEGSIEDEDDFESESDSHDDLEVESKDVYPSEEMLNIPTETSTLSSEEDSTKVKNLKRIIEGLNSRLDEQTDFINRSVSKEDYDLLKKELDAVSEEKERFEDAYNNLSKSSDSLGEEHEDLKLKFKDLMIRFKSVKEELVQLKKTGVPKLTQIKRGYPNVEFIVPLSSGSVTAMYEYISGIDGKILFIDLTNNSYLDNFIKIKDRLVRPTKWLKEDWSYRDVVAESTSHSNIRLISSVVHLFDSSTLVQLDWDRVLGDLATENKVVINIGTIHENGVLDVLKAVQSGVAVKGIVGDKQRDQRIGKLALTQLPNCRVLAHQGVADNPNFKIITERY